MPDTNSATSPADNDRFDHLLADLTVTRETGDALYLHRIAASTRKRYGLWLVLPPRVRAFLRLRGVKAPCGRELGPQVDRQRTMPVYNPKLLFCPRCYKVPSRW